MTDQTNFLDFEDNLDELNTQESDSLGYKPLDTDEYPAEIKLAYFTQAASGAKAIHVDFEVQTPEGVVSRSKDYYYTDKTGSIKDAKDPTKAGYGFIQTNALCLSATGLGIKEQKASKKIVEIYNKEAKGKAPTEVLVIDSLLNKKVVLLVEQQKKNKQKKVGTTYKNTSEAVVRDEIVKVLHVSRKTVSELKAKKEKPEFADAWLEKNKGKVIDKMKDADVAGDNAPSLDTSSTGSESTESLF